MVLTAVMWLGRCPSCRTPAAQEAVHDCCQKDRCHRDSGAPSGKTCPHQAATLEQYAKTDPVTPVAASPAVLLEACGELAPLPAVRASSAVPLLVHSPPELFLRNSALLI